ncbi:MAG TPA: discoidin domain-containing protein [Candidatus Limnocylindria bacterium]|nr:discoidin domain-containing protein [Candidatus Limnocylindria bacterium]
MKALASGRTFFAILVGILLTAGSRAESTSKPLQVLLITGGCCHDYEAQKGILAAGIEERANIKVTVVYQGGDRTDSRIPLYENPNWAKGYDAVIHDECFSDVKDTNWVAGILAPHRAGLPGVVLHCAMHCYRTGTDDWFEFCGVTSRRHGAQYPHAVLNRDGAHPIMKEFGPAWANPAGELYWIEKVWPTAHPLASSKNQENGHDEVCVWANQYRSTRVFGTTLGHHNETVSSPAYLDLVTRGLLWACGKLDAGYLKPVLPKTVPVNVAKGSKASASSEQQGPAHPAKDAIDGDPGSRWCASDGSAPQWWQVELAKEENTTGANIDWESSRAYRYKIDLSLDGKTWQTMADGSQNTANSPSDLHWNTTPARFLKITFLGGPDGGWGSIKEVQVYGDRQVTVDPKELKLSADKQLLGDTKVPADFEGTLFAAPPAVNYPVFVAAAPDGTVFVSSDKNGSLDRAPHRGAVYRLRDLDGDGRADESKLFVADVDTPRGLVWDHDRLYVLHPPNISAYIDHDGDGIADEEKVLVKGVAFTFKDRPGDHSSNGLELGVDGWLYCAIGDFGFMEAEGTDGHKLQLRGGGVVRVRTDGTGLEIYARGTRNILEAAVSPELDVLERDNTNDGGGWDVRLHHSTQLGQHGYPSLYQHFADEIIPPLADYGGGSGCGALFLDEPGFSAGFSPGLYTSDWGREWVYRHQLTRKGATFSIDQKEFVHATRITDLDVDGSSHLYIASWKGATFTYAGENVGYLLRVTPKGYQAEPLPDFTKLSPAKLVKHLESTSHRRRLAAQRELLLHKPERSLVSSLEKLAASPTASEATHVAAIFTLKQWLHEKATPYLVTLTKNPSVRQYALRALTDRLDELAGVPVEPLLAGLKDTNPRVRQQAIVSLVRLGQLANASAVAALLDDDDQVVAHTAVQGLARLAATDALLAILDSHSVSATARQHAVHAIQLIHQPGAVDGLVARLEKENDATRRSALITALCRLFSTDGVWKGDSWGTRPDTSGPYYQPTDWSETPKIGAALTKALSRSSATEAQTILRELARHKVNTHELLLEALSLAAKMPEVTSPVVDQLAQSNPLPVEALPFLTSVATDDSTPAATRVQAVVALEHSDDSKALPAMLAALAKLSTEAGSPIEPARNAYMNSARLANRVDALVANAKAVSGDASAWADGGLLALSTRNKLPAAIKTNVVQALDDGWSVPARRTQILRAVALIGHKPSEKRVLEALDDADPAVVKNSMAAAKALKLNTDKAKADSGPQIGSLKTEEVIAAIVKIQGSAGLGEQLFTRQGCVTCHTVKQDQPLRGPFLGAVATLYRRPELAEAILLPNKSIAQGFATHHFEMEDGNEYEGFVTQEAADKVTIRNATGQETVILVSRISKRTKLETSIMPEGLAANLTVKEFASLLDYLESLAKK